jgi:predicted ATP-dependent serine protease
MRDRNLPSGAQELPPETTTEPSLATTSPFPFTAIVGQEDLKLAILLAVLSSLRNRPLPMDLVAFGEIGLAGEIRPVTGGPERLREAAKHGFKRAIVPKGNAPKPLPPDMEVHVVTRLEEALEVSKSFDH